MDVAYQANSSLWRKKITEHSAGDQSKKKTEPNFSQIPKSPPNEMRTSITVDDKLAKELCDTCKVVSDAPTIQCDCCRYWFHSQCEKRDLDERSEAEHWYCSKCQQLLDELDKALGSGSTKKKKSKKSKKKCKEKCKKKIANESELSDASFEGFRFKPLKVVPTDLNGPTDETPEEDIRSDCATASTSSSADEKSEDVNLDSCQTCRACNGEEPVVRCDRCQFLFHYNCSIFMYKEEVEQWQCQACRELPVDSEKAPEVNESIETQKVGRLTEGEFLDQGLLSVSDFLDHLVSEVGPIKEPTFRAKLELCKRKIEAILNQSPSAEDEQTNETIKPFESKKRIKLENLVPFEDPVDLSTVKVDETKKVIKQEANSPVERIGFLDLAFEDEYKQMNR